MLWKMKERCKNKKGFTMVELIIVIVIIVVLAAVLVPNLLKYVDKANQATCKNNAATILTQVQAETAEEFATGTATPANITVNSVTVTYQGTGLTIAAKGTGAAAEYVVDVTSTSAAYGTVTDFAYQDGKHFIRWNNITGWADIDSTTP